MLCDIGIPVFFNLCVMEPRVSQKLYSSAMIKIVKCWCLPLLMVHYFEINVLFLAYLRYFQLPFSAVQSVCHSLWDVPNIVQECSDQKSVSPCVIYHYFVVNMQVGKLPAFILINMIQVNLG